MGINNPGPLQVAHNGEDYCVHVPECPRQLQLELPPPKKKRLIQEGYATTLEEKKKNETTRRGISSWESFRVKRGEVGGSLGSLPLPP